MDVSIIIVNWNTGTLLRKCLDAIPDAVPGLEYEVIVIDNASSDQSIAHAEGSPQQFRLLAQRKNLGFAKANNIGVRQSSGDVVFFLNPDTEPFPGSIHTLHAFLQSRSNVACVGPRLRNTDGTLQPSCRRFPGIWVLVSTLLKIHRIKPDMKILKQYMMSEFTYDKDTRVDQVMGAAMAIPRATLDRIGLLDEGYWIWFEEVDWCRRAYAAGKEVWFTPTSEITHHGGSSFIQVIPVRKEWRFARSAVRYARKHIGVSAALVLILLTPIALVLDAVSCVVRSRTSS